MSKDLNDDLISFDVDDINTLGDEYADEYDDENIDISEDTKPDETNELDVDTLDSLVELLDDGEGETLNDPEVIKKIMEGEDDLAASDGKEVDVIYDNEGNIVDFLMDGEIYTDEIPLSDILIPPRARRLENIHVDDLEKSILQWGLIVPLHVIPFGDKYLLVHGLRRLYALKNLGYDKCVCLVDTTRHKATVRFLEAICNNSKKYDFYELMALGDFIERKQSTFKTETIENILGLEPGDYLKAKYLLQLDEFGIIKDVVVGRKTIKEGFKKLERELDKRQKEKEDIMNYGNTDPESYLEAVEESPRIQDTQNREPLPSYLYAKIKARDRYICQTCGLGLNNPELNAVFEVHHIIPVSMGGSDDEENLILLCSNCHKIVGAYINGEFIPPKDKVDIYSNLILLGNIARKGLLEGYTPYRFYIENYNPYWE